MNNQMIVDLIVWIGLLSVIPLTIITVHSFSLWRVYFVGKYSRKLCYYQAKELAEIYNGKVLFIWQN